MVNEVTKWKFRIICDNRRTKSTQGCSLFSSFFFFQSPPGISTSNFSSLIRQQRVNLQFYRFYSSFFHSKQVKKCKTFFSTCLRWAAEGKNENNNVGRREFEGQLRNEQIINYDILLEKEHEKLESYNFPRTDPAIGKNRTPIRSKIWLSMRGCSWKKSFRSI